MSSSRMLTEPAVVDALSQAWNESRPGPAGGHEQGGFILRDSAGKITIARWPQGETDMIAIPGHENCRFGDNEIIATFHTHPNTGSDYLQEPAESDRRAVRDDPDLKGAEYVGEFVVSQSVIYLISPVGEISEAAATLEIFSGK